MSLDLSSYESSAGTTIFSAAWNGALNAIQAFVNSLPIANLAGYPADATKVLKGDGTWGQLAAAATQSSPSNETSTGGSNLMLGLAGTITPTATGRIKVTIDGTFKNDNNGNGSGSACQLRYGTGTAPANAAAAAGTAAGATLTFTQNPSAVPFSITRTITGLTLNTAVWLDLSDVAAGGATNTFASINVLAVEF